MPVFPVSPLSYGWFLPHRGRRCYFCCYCYCYCYYRSYCYYCYRNISLVLTSHSCRALTGMCRMCSMLAASRKRMSCSVSSDAPSSARKNRKYSPITWTIKPQHLSHQATAVTKPISTCSWHQSPAFVSQVVQTASVVIVPRIF